jgi:serine/threonine-protein kinase
VALSVAVLAAGCTSHHPGSGTTTGGAQQAAVRAASTVASRGAWEGDVKGTNAFVAVVSDGIEVTGYVCDGDKLAAWFRGPASGGHPHLVSDSGAILDATVGKSEVTGRVVTADGRSFDFTAPARSSNVLYRANDTINGSALLAGWVIGPHGAQRGSVSFGNGTSGAPPLTANQLGSPTIGVSIPALGSTNAVVAVAVVPAALSPATTNTTGFNQFVFVGLGDSFGAGNGNPFKSSGLTVQPSLVTPWDKLAAACPLAGGVGGALAGAAGPIGAGLLVLSTLGCPGLAAAAVGARAFGETSVPELPGLTDPGSTEQWGGSAASPGRPADENYRTMCHRGKSTSEKVFEKLSADPKYASIQFVYYNFACSGSQVRHIYNQPYDGDNEKRVPNANNQIPPQLDQVRAFLGDQGSFGPNSTARTFIDAQHVSQTSPAIVQTPHIDAAYISTGGNDSGFSHVILFCTILPLPDCGSDELAKVTNGGGGPQGTLAPSNPDNDSDFFGLKSLPSSYQALAQSLDTLTVKRGPNPNFPTSDMQDFPITPDHVYLGEYPNPIAKDATGALCDSTTGPLKNDTMGLGSAVDAGFANNFLGMLDKAVDAAGAAHATPTRSDGRGGWTIVPNQNSFMGHGICTTGRFVNTGRDALTLTGDDLTPHAILDISAAIAHPNDGGYTALAAPLETQLRAQLDAMIAAAPAKPANLREVGAKSTGEIDLRWDDTANNESTYQVLSRPFGSTADFTIVSPNLPRDSEEFNDARSGPRTAEYKVRACTVFGHCTDSDVVIATNQAAVVPTGLTAGFSVNRLAVSTSVSSVDVAWSPDPRNTEVELDIRAQVGNSDVQREYVAEQHSNPPVTRGATPVRPVDPPAAFHLTSPVDPATPGHPMPDSGTYTITVRGCNILGCSAATAPVTVNVAIPTLAPGPTVVGPTTSFTTVKLGG